MKKLTLAIAGSLVILAIAGHVNGQNTNEVTLEGVKYLQANLSISNGAMLEKANFNYSADAHSKAIKDFKRTFKTASNERWAPVTDGFIATFTDGAVKTAVSYNKKGIWQHTIRYYGADQLPSDVRADVMKANYDSQISQVEEIEMSDKKVFLVHLEGKADRKLIRYCNSEMETLVSADKN